MSLRTLETHWGKHHRCGKVRGGCTSGAENAPYLHGCFITPLPPHKCRTYCENLNKQVAGTELETKSLKEVVLAAWSGGKTLPCFNNAAQVGLGKCEQGCGGWRLCGHNFIPSVAIIVIAQNRCDGRGSMALMRPLVEGAQTVPQVWNHTFFWDSMKPGGGGSPDAGGKLAAAIDRDFGSLDGLRKELQVAIKTATQLLFVLLTMIDGTDSIPNHLPAHPRHPLSSSLTHAVPPPLSS